MTRLELCVQSIHVLLQTSPTPLTAQQLTELSGERPENVQIALNTLIVLGEVDKGFQDSFGRQVEVYWGTSNAAKH